MSNEQQKIEGLLKPRYEVIAPYPAYKSHGIEVGDILTDPGGHECVRNQKGQAVAAFDWDMFPHLFKPLPWYAKRSVEEMPDYVKFVKDYMDFKKGQVFKTHPTKKDLSKNMIGFLLNPSQKSLIGNGIYVPASFSQLMPSTLAEYIVYRNSKK